MLPSDWELLEAWRRGEKSAGTELVRRYYPSVQRFFANKVAQRQDATDLTQETFKACVERKEYIRGEASFRGYLFGTAINMLRRYIGKKTKRDREAADFAEMRVNDYVPVSMTSIVARKREQMLLVSALRELPLEQQIVLELTLFDEQPAREIAERLGVPEGTVRSRLRLGRARLTERLTELAAAPDEANSTLMDLETWAAQIRALIDDDRIEGSKD